jgi:hypothetical protein
LPALRLTVCSGESLRPFLVAGGRDSVPGRLVNQYGPTETHVCTRYLLPADPADWPLLPSIGTPIDGVRAHVLDTGGRPVPDGEPGELHVAGVAVAHGYVGRPDLTRQRFRAEPGGPGRMYATGDLVERRDGQLYYLGRDDDQVKINGIRVEPAEVERELLAFPGVREAAVVASRTDAVTRLVAFVTGDLDAADDADLRRRLAGSLPSHLVPHRIVTLPALPLTPSGKVDRNTLAGAAPERAGAAPERACAAPDSGGTLPDSGGTLPDSAGSAGSAADVTELAAIWHAELGSVDERAEDLRAGGVDSLAAARIAARIAKRFGVLVPVDRLLDAGSLDHLAAIVASSPPVASLSGDAPAGPRPVTAMQRQVFIDEMWQGGPTHWVLAELDITGAFDPAAAESAIRALTRRHAALRTRFDFTGPDITQEYVADAQPVVAHTTPADLATLRERRLAEVYEFGSVATPLADIVRLDDRHHRILLRMHHAYCDGWSIPMLFDEFAALYGGASLPDAPQPWHLHAGDDVHDRDLTYWLKCLAPVAGRPPVDWGRSRGPSAGLRRMPVALDADDVAAVRKRAWEARSTPYAVLLAAWAGLFGGEGNEVCVAVAVSTRATAQDAGCVGLHLNTLVLPLATGADTVTAHVEQVQRDVAEARRHCTAPLPDILRGLGVELPVDHHPLAQMLFVLQPPGPRQWTFPDGARAELVLDVGVVETTRFDVVVNLDDRGDRISGWIDYDPGAVDREHINTLTRLWLLALRS